MGKEEEKFTLQSIDKLIKKNLTDTENNPKKEIQSIKKDLRKELKDETEMLRAENEKLRKKVEKQEGRKTLIFRGIPQTDESQKDEIANLANIFENMGCDSLNIEDMVVFARRFGKTEEKRVLKVECNTIRDSQKICG